MSLERRPNDDGKRWLDHRHYRTYEIATRLSRMVVADLNELTFLEDEIIAFLSPWQRESAVHKLAYFVADEMFRDDIDGPYLRAHEGDPTSRRLKRHLPVDAALLAYGLIEFDAMFKIPEPDGREVRDGNVIGWEESSAVANACYRYTVDLQQTAVYDQLVSQVADEVFHTVFPNRLLLGRLHRLLAVYVQGLDPAGFETEPELARLFRRDGRLKRSSPPRWVKSAIFFRDRGHCAGCRTDLTGLIHALPSVQFDHIVPLDRGGLNDITNLQMLCQPCNREKAASLVEPSGKHERYYER